MHYQTLNAPASLIPPLPLYALHRRNKLHRVPGVKVSVCCGRCVNRLPFESWKTLPNIINADVLENMWFLCYRLEEQHWWAGRLKPV